MTTPEFATATEREALCGFLDLQRAALVRKVQGVGDMDARRADPQLRPADAVPVEFVLMAYPVLGLPPLPEDDEADQDGEAGKLDGPGWLTSARARPECQTPLA